jgi:RNA polymerase sigma-70 factor (ECF subfamily)
MGAISVADLGDGSKAVAPAVPTVVDRFPSEYTDFFRRELRPLIALAAAIAGTDRAEEIAQEALLRAHRDWDRISRYDKPGAWARRVTINLATSAQRRRGVEARALRRVATRRQLDVPPPEVDGFWALVRQLPDRQAAAVALHYVSDLSIAEIADILGCAEGTAKAHLHSARRALADLLRNQEHS